MAVTVAAVTVGVAVSQARWPRWTRAPAPCPAGAVALLLGAMTPILLAATAFAWLLQTLSGWQF